MSKHNEISLYEAIQKMIDTYKWQRKIKEQRIISNWGRLMGKIVAQHTIRVYIQNKKIFLLIDTSALKQELHYRKKQMLKIIQDYVGQGVIEDIVLL